MQLPINLGPIHTGTSWSESPPGIKNSGFAPFHGIVPDSRAPLKRQMIKPPHIETMARCSADLEYGSASYKSAYEYRSVVFEDADRKGEIHKEAPNRCCFVEIF